MYKEYGIVLENKNLKEYNTYKLESICKYLIIVNDIIKLMELIKYLNNNKVKYFIIGNGSNLILPSFYDGVVIKLDLNKLFYNGDILEVEASYMINKLGFESASKGYAGLEWASGLPGTVGGTIVNNSGCYGSSIMDNLIKVDVLKDNEILTLNKDEIDYSYRHTSLKNNGYVVLKAYFKLNKSSKEELLSLIKERNLKRVESQPLELPSAGSVFRNPEGDYAGRLIEDSGLKGKIIGGAMVSLKHANFIVNKCDATSEDIINLINLIKETVYDKHKIKLILEQEIIN